MDKIEHTIMNKDKPARNFISRWWKKHISDKIYARKHRIYSEYLEANKIVINPTHCPYLKKDKTGCEITLKEPLFPRCTNLNKYISCPKFKWQQGMNSIMNEDFEVVDSKDEIKPIKLTTKFPMNGKNYSFDDITDQMTDEYEEIYTDVMKDD